MEPIADGLELAEEENDDLLAPDSRYDAAKPTPTDAAMHAHGFD